MKTAPNCAVTYQEAKNQSARRSGAAALGIEIRDNHVGKAAYAVRSFEQGALILRTWGERSPCQLRESMQVDSDLHIVPPPPLRYFNHSCEPNCGAFIRRGVEEIQIDALRPINAGKELTLDYATFEYQIEHFTEPCLCHSRRCRGIITGYKSLPRHLRQAYGRYIAEYLRDATVCP